MKNDIKNIIVIGVTGYVGSGKTLFCEIVEKNYNCKVVYTDNVAKDIIDTDDRFMYLRNRKGDILSDEEISKVKDELHPVVWQNVKNTIISNMSEIDFFLVETALPSMQFFDICNKTILIQNNIDIKTNILKAKRDYNDNIINAILKSQDYYKNHYEKCDFVIDNNGTKIDFQNNIFKIINKIIGK